LVADALKLQRGINGEWNELEGLLREVEDPLQKRKDEIDKAEENRKAEEKRKLEEKRDQRVADLLNNGMTLQGGFYAIGEDITMDVVTIQAMTDDAFDVFRGRVVKVNEKQLEAKRLQEEAEEAERQEHALPCSYF
jgi:phosphate uptake regulator